MKKGILLLASLLAIVGVYAQPTLTGAANNPVAGERFYGHYCDVTGVSSGASGASVTWDYSALAPFYIDSLLFETCASTPYCDSFPGSTLAVSDGSGYEYYITDVNKFAVSGYGVPVGKAFFTDPQNLISYPMTYNDTAADTFFSFQPVFESFSYGLDSFMADGYGTLILPSGTYTNALRVHLVSYSTDSLASGGVLESTRDELYMWFSPGFHFPLLVMSYDTSGGPAYLSEVTYYTQNLALKTPGMLENATNVNVYPNPANDEVHVSLYSRTSQPVTITALDMTGRVVGAAVKADAVTGQNDITYSVSTLPAGSYLLRIQTDDNSVLKKFVKTE